MKEYATEVSGKQKRQCWKVTRYSQRKLPKNFPRKEYRINWCLKPGFMTELHPERYAGTGSYTEIRVLTIAEIEAENRGNMYK